VTLIRLLGVLAISAVWLSGVQASPIDKKVTVCPSEEVTVRWRGPGRPGDRIVIAKAGEAPGEESWGYAEVLEGNPLTVTAPTLPGTYEKRYLQASPLAVLDEGELEVVACGASCDIQDYPVDKHAVLAHTLTFSTNHGPEETFNVDALCTKRREVFDHARDVIGRAEAPLGVPEELIDSHTQTQLSNARGAVCVSGERFKPARWGTYVYSSCRLVAQSGSYTMDIHLPSDVGDGTMQIADHEKRQVLKVNLQRKIGELYAGTGSGWGTDIELEQIGVEQRIGYQTTGYEIEYAMGTAFGQERVKGTAWLASCAPGIDIATAYHEKLTRELQPSDDILGAYASLVKNQVAMLEHGLPLDIETEHSGGTMGIPGPSVTDRNVVTGFKVIPTPDKWCVDSMMPPDYEVIDLHAELEAAMKGQPGMPPGGGAEMQEAMKEMQRAMQQMTPEQRAMMEKLGVGNQLPGMMPQTTPQAAPAPAPKPASTAVPCSDALYSDNTTLMVQSMLDALDYDVGKPDGIMDTQTIIAISEFQAEKGLDITGEVSPQLAGILSAEVDQRCRR